MNIDEQLSRLDPARSVPEGLADGARAEATLATLLAEGPTTAPTSRPRRRIAPYLLAAGVAGLGGTLIANTLGGATAYATWTATPTQPTAAEEARHGQDCLTWHATRAYSVRLVELRGRYAYTVLSGPDGYEATCLVEDGAAGEPFEVGFEGRLGQAPGPRSLTTNSVRAQTNAEGATSFEVTGRAGPEVSSVSFDVSGQQVQATLKDGYFAAWWPGGSSMVPRFGPPNPNVTVTLTDGTSSTKPIQDYDISPL